MQDLVQWEHRGEEGLVLRGWRTPPRALPVIFFLHGNGLCAMSYWPMLERLRARFDLVLLDAPGHGLSDSAGHFQGWQQDASCCLQAWMSLQGDYSSVCRHVVAHSYGGVLSTFMLAEEPQSFDSAVLLDPVYFPLGMLALGRLMSVFGLLKYTKMARLTSKRRHRWPDRAAARTYLLERRIYARWEPACFEAYLACGFAECDDGEGVRLRCERELEAQIFSTLPYALPKMIAKISTPCIIYSGDQSYDFVIKALPKYCSGHEYIDHREISGGHNFMLEQTENTALLVSDAIEQLG